MQIRLVRPGDEADFVQCVQRSGLSATPEAVLYYLHHPLICSYLAEVDGRVVGTGVVITYGDRTGWIGVITVLPEYQRRGIGRALTEWAVSWLRQRGARTVLLTASAEGLPVYEKMGFTTHGAYQMMLGPAREHPIRDPRIRPMFPADLPGVDRLDRAATGEDRSGFFRTLQLGYVSVARNGSLSGFHLSLPTGGGSVIAHDAETGILMLELYRSLRPGGPVRLILPEANRAGVEYLVSQGFEVYRRNPLLILGPVPEPYRPEQIFACFSFGLG